MNRFLRGCEVILLLILISPAVLSAPCDLSFRLNSQFKGVYDHCYEDSGYTLPDLEEDSRLDISEVVIINDGNCTSPPFQLIFSMYPSSDSDKKPNERDTREIKFFLPPLEQNQTYFLIKRCVPGEIPSYIDSFNETLHLPVVPVRLDKLGSWKLHSTIEFSPQYKDNYTISGYSIVYNGRPYKQFEVHDRLTLLNTQYIEESLNATGTSIQVAQRSLQLALWMLIIALVGLGLTVLDNLGFFNPLTRGSIWFSLRNPVLWLNRIQLKFIEWKIPRSSKSEKSSRKRIYGIKRVGYIGRQLYKQEEIELSLETMAILVRISKALGEASPKEMHKAILAIFEECNRYFNLVIMNDDVDVAQSIVCTMFEIGREMTHSDSTQTISVSKAFSELFFRVSALKGTRTHDVIIHHVLTYLGFIYMGEESSEWSIDEWFNGIANFIKGRNYIIDSTVEFALVTADKGEMDVFETVIETFNDLETRNHFSRGEVIEQIRQRIRNLESQQAPEDQIHAWQDFKREFVGLDEGFRKRIRCSVFLIGSYLLMRENAVFADKLIESFRRFNNINQTFNQVSDRSAHWDARLFHRRLGVFTADAQPYFVAFKEYFNQRRNPPDTS